ncbi:hypothetical protein P5673_029537 [Acropora cervicornis]|uniref:C-type lectin domain-containing protein n=1 Tax=Acropora cervicornis TaxID=6130 RepID=A0AAD9UUA5_ACRCE|nr:hypothetical protein P5673_029537 [Acropora cervicornis]
MNLSYTQRYSKLSFITFFFSVSCPPEWMIEGELCYLYKGVAFTYKEAEEYCENYGGFVMDVASVANRRLVQRLREEESLLTWEKQMPTLWTTKAFSVNSDRCFTVNNTGEIEESDCDRRHPFVCTRRAGIYH